MALKDKPSQQPLLHLKIEYFTPQAEEQEKYSSILQGKSTNALTKTSKKSLELDPLTGNATITREGVQIFLTNYNNLILNVQTHKVLDALTIKLTQNFPYGKSATSEQINKHREVTITVDEYMNLCGIKDRKEARKQLKEALLTIYNLSVEWGETRYHIPKGKKRRVKETMHYKARLVDFMGEELSNNPIKNGKGIVKFTYDIADYLSKAFIMAYPNKLLTIKANYNPHSYYIGRKLAEHHNMNIGKNNANRIAVNSLLNALPDLPTYDEVMNSNSKSVTQKIIKPFERDLIALKNTYSILADWKYCNSKGEPITDEQAIDYSYNVWEKWLIEFKFNNYPDQSKRLEKIKDIRKAKAKTASKNKE